MARIDEATVSWRVFLFVFSVCVAFFAIGWARNDGPEKKPQLEVIGGNFSVDNETSRLRYNLVIKKRRKLRHGMIIEADFEDPAGHGYYVVRMRTQRWRSRYVLRSPPVCGVRARKRYLVMLRLFNDRGDQQLWSDVVYVTSQLGEDLLSQVPVTTRPGRDFTPYQ
ncbi:hypothetical protein AB2N04_09925 [Nitratireductor sp. GISD-1A_MAKvit]|uniref:hypothetical protein n=1 Tax=Nitratireductor sp. GISD-1A_MAKvit TaxID=3234198 RepID=UPI003465745A